VKVPPPLPSSFIMEKKKLIFVISIEKLVRINQKYYYCKQRLQKMLGIEAERSQMTSSSQFWPVLKQTVFLRQLWISTKLKYHNQVIIVQIPGFHTRISIYLCVESVAGNNTFQWLITFAWDSGTMIHVVSVTWAQFHQHAFKGTNARLSTSITSTITCPTLPVHSTRSYTQLLCHVHQRNSIHCLAQKLLIEHWWNWHQGFHIQWDVWAY